MEGYEQLELSTQIVIKEALQRDIDVEILDWSDNFIRLKKGNKMEYVKQATKTSADSYISPLIMGNKEVTKGILHEHDINVPQGMTAQSVEEAVEHYSEFSNKDIVIKPKSTNFGKGVTILKQSYSLEEYKKAVISAFNEDNSVIIEEFISGKEYRFLVIGDKVAAILHRVPANVTGDGIHTIEELVKEKNKDPLRGRGYVTPLEKVNLGEDEREYLEFQNKNFEYVPQKAETVFLRENSNISTGGDSIDFTDDIIDDYQAIAVRSAKAVGANICGADIIIKDIYAKPNNLNYSVIELNFNPALHIHNFPFKGENRQVEKKIMDLLDI
ncbi:bifunctional glutamate--cysteine ligase GshA/glutathione synthetase GshB [Terrihalobacillus insolitus]|uniref:bifunctional glutamate--cysteine ligase GshA/glutathione synthetase GshB n=1 Tax=Terrihalobacillus insolitus TaxID=2950438 RepID=UPI002342024C|nr:bifunctional glutamate--cysteine ligase GshA/glutathione synthetase GshB [Terrihalobacillus insolitus]MDC3412942.1 bifunctional glutamate--cysteine ligase GshA/glutathione synthetase GshB [Terrihalobacillus insolitus]